MIRCVAPRRFRFTLLFWFLALGPALAMVGGAPPADPAIARHVVQLVGSRGNSCSGVAIARDLVLTAAHCVVPGADYKIVALDAAHHSQLKEVAAVARHPQFDLAAFAAHRATADVALLKLAAPLPASIVPSPLARERTVAVGEAFIVAGYGIAQRDGRPEGAARTATLAVTGQPGTLQVRLFDPATKGEHAGLGACEGDSGAPAFETGERHAVIGVVSWTTGPQLTDGCGGLTGLTPLTRYRAWIVETAGKLGSSLVP